MSDLTKDKNIKFFYIGNSETKKKIGDYPSNFDPSVFDIVSKIYEKIDILGKNTEVNKFGSANNQDTYVLINTSNKFLYLAITSQEYKKESVVNLFKELEYNSVHLLTDSNGVLNEMGKKSLKEAINNYENKRDIMKDLNSDINDVKIELQENIKKQLANNESSERLSESANKLKDQANVFKNDSNKLKNITCWQNCKWTIVLITVVLLLIMIIVVPIVVSASKASPSDGNNSNNVNSNTTLRFLSMENFILNYALNN